MRALLYFAFVAASALLAGCSSGDDARLSSNKELVREFADVSNAANWQRLDEIVAADFQRHSAATAGEPVRSLAEFIALQESFMSTFPDQRVHLEQMIAEGDYVAVRARYTATHTGQLGEFAATGKAIDSPFIAVFRLESGKIRELWIEWDNVFVLSQLGLFPPPSPPVD